MTGTGAPFLTEQPVDQTAVAGEVRIIRARAAGTSPMTYQWQHNGASISGATNWFLLQSEVSTQDSGDYTLVVSNSFGTCTSRVAKLQVYVPPTITAQVTNQCVNVGATASLSVQASGPGPLSYQWKKANRSLVNDSRITGANSPTLTISDTRPQDIGVYRVTVSNADGLVSSHMAILQVGQTSLAAWGENWYGETYVPTDVTNVISLSSWNSILALKADGTLIGWGKAGFNSPTNSTPLGLSNLVSLASEEIGLKHDGTVVHWGDPTELPVGLKNVVEVDAGGYHFLALKADGTVVAWPQPNVNSYPFFQVPAGVTNIAAIATGYDVDLALKSDGSLIAWAANWEPSASVPPGLSNVIAIASCYNYFFALQSNGVVTAWDPLLPNSAEVPNGWTNIVTIAAAWGGCIALKNDGDVLTFRNYLPDTKVPSGLTNIATLLAAGYSSFAIIGESTPNITTQPKARTSTLGSEVLLSVTASGTRPLAYQWYFNDTKLPAATNQELILHQLQPADAGAYSVTVSNNQGTATSAKAQIDLGPLLGWGFNQYGVLEIPPGRTKVTAFGNSFSMALIGDAPSQEWGWWDGKPLVAPDLSDVISIAGGYSQWIALRSNGTLLCWGLPPSVNDIPSGLAKIKAIAAGSGFNVALTEDGKIAVWGLDFTGAPTNTFLDITDAVAIAAGNSVVCALRQDGSVVLWPNWSSTNVPCGISNVIAISTCGSDLIGLHPDGTVVEWNYQQTNPFPTSATSSTLLLDGPLI